MCTPNSARNSATAVPVLTFHVPQELPADQKGTDKMPQSVRNPEGRRLPVDHLTVRAISNVHEQRTLLISANDYRMGTATRVNSPLEEASHVSLYNHP